MGLRTKTVYASWVVDTNTTFSKLQGYHTIINPLNTQKGLSKVILLLDIGRRAKSIRTYVE